MPTSSSERKSERKWGPEDDRQFVRDQILRCTGCELREGARSPVSFTAPPLAPLAGGTPPSLLIIGEGPGATEDREGKPFVGVSGQLLRNLLREVGIDPESCAWTNTVQCFGNKTPGPSHVEACRRNKWDVVQLIQPEYILIFGAVALSGFRPDLKISQVHGRPLCWGRGDQVDSRIQHWRDNVVIWPTFHPAAALREISIADEIRGDLQQFKLRMNGGWSSFITSWPMDCMVCGSEPDHIDQMGVGYCARHWEKQLTLLDEGGMM